MDYKITRVSGEKQLKFTFEDGSSGYLRHYGVKGMQWGVHNEETMRRYGELAGKYSAEAGAVATAAFEFAASGGQLHNALSAGIGIYAASKISSAAIKAGKPVIDKLVKDPKKNAKIQEGYANRVNAAALAGVNATSTLLGTGGNVAAAGFSFGVTYASTRIAQEAVKAGKPLIDKVVKDPSKRDAVYMVSEVGVSAAASAGLTQVGLAAVNGVLAVNSMNNYLNNEAPRPTDEFFEQLHGVYNKPEHMHGGNQPSTGISQQLAANVPDSLKRRV